jgi:hypothetical protein
LSKLFSLIGLKREKCVGTFRFNSSQTLLKKS